MDLTLQSKVWGMFKITEIGFWSTRKYMVFPYWWNKKRESPNNPYSQDLYA